MQDARSVAQSNNGSRENEITAIDGNWTEMVEMVNFER